MHGLCAKCRDVSAVPCRLLLASPGPGPDPHPPRALSSACRDKSEWLKHSNAMSGPTMMFATLKQPKAGVDYTKDELGKVTQKWRELLLTAGLEATCYDIGTNKVLLTTQQGWRGYELRDFVMQQSELEELEWDQVRYTPGEKLDATVDAPRHPGAEPSMEDIIAAMTNKDGDKSKKTKGKGKKAKAAKEAEEL